MSQAAVELRQASKRFGTVVALGGVDLSVQAGEFLTLLGPSGCGKTTLLRLIGGFDTPDTGSVWLEGVDVTEVPAYRRAVNTVFQNYALFPHLTVFGNVAFGLKMQQVSAAAIGQRVAEALALVSLSGLDARRPHQLSGGQRQRVALARALVCRPKVLLLDEPLAALDAKLRHAMQLELKALQRKVGLTFIFVTHDQQEALAMSDRIALLNEGRIEQIGSAEEIYARPRTAFVADFIGRANLVEAKAVGPGKYVSSDGMEWAVAGDDVGRDLRGSVRLVIRPEKIAVLVAEPSQGFVAGPRTGDEALGAFRPNRFAATVVATAFKGAATEVVLETRTGRRLSAQCAAALALGTTVKCTLRPDDIIALD